MSRFADPAAVREVDLGACECPGTPHSRDWAKVRADLSGSELNILLNLGGLSQDEAAERIAPFIDSWNLLGPTGDDWPPSPAALYALKGPTAQAIGAAIAAVVDEVIGPLPKPTGARSRDSSRASASPTPTMTPGT